MWSALGILLLTASVVTAQTVRLQDGTSPNLATVDSTGALKVNTAGGSGGTTGTQTVSAAALLVRAIPNLYCENTAAISQATSTQVIAGTANTKTYLCTVFVFSGTTQNVSVVEGTGGTCGSNTVGMVGGTSPVIAFVANQGFVIASTGPTLRTAGTATNVCLLQSGAGVLGGTITWHQE